MTATPMNTAQRTEYRGQYRERRSTRWVTACERGSASSCWDEMLSSGLIPKGADLRVVEVGRENLRAVR